MESIQLKFEFENSLRRISFNKNDTLEKLKKTICSLIGVDSIDIKYKDEEGDHVTIGTDEELQELVALNSKSGKILRLLVTPVLQSQNPPMTEPEIPFANVARPLSDEEIVGRIQAALSSPIITHAVTTIAKTYMDSKGDFKLTMLTAHQQLPKIMSWIEVASEDLPVLKEISSIVTKFSDFQNVFLHPQAVPVATAASSPSKLFPHPHVFCDGCSSNPELKEASINAGYCGRHRGMIKGLRFRSQTAPNFDLCESCKGTGRFDFYGPFDVIQPSARGVRGGGGRGNWWRNACDPQDWRSRRNEATDQSSETTPFAAFANVFKNENKGEFESNPLFEAIKSAFTQGAQQVAEAAAANNENDAELTELARVISESLKDEKEQQPTEKWSAQLSQLATLGFVEHIDKYVEFLEQEKGDMEKVVNLIVTSNLDA